VSSGEYGTLGRCLHIMMLPAQHLALLQFRLQLGSSAGCVPANGEQLLLRSNVVEM
jgi:hypothetical protein